MESCLTCLGHLLCLEQRFLLLDALLQQNRAQSSRPLPLQSCENRNLQSKLLTTRLIGQTIKRD